MVSDSVYKRLEAYIDIPLLDLNLADSADFDGLPGIGGYFASRMVEYRRRLGGYYSYKEQLMDIYNFDKEKYDGLADLVTIAACPPVQDDMQDLHQNSGNLEVLMLVERLQILDFLTATGTGPGKKLLLLIGNDKLLTGPRMPFPGTSLLPGGIGILGGLGSIGVSRPLPVLIFLLSIRSWRPKAIRTPEAIRLNNLSSYV